jgi:hypothetical protein
VSARALAALSAALLACACGEEQTAPEPATPAPNALPAAAGGAQDAPAVWFEDATAEFGLDFVHDAGLSPEKHLPETMGGGAALADLDADGDLDVYLVQSGPMRLGGSAPGTFVDPPGPLPGNRLFANAGDGRLSDVTAASGDAADTGYGMGVVYGDATGDGHLDLYVTNLGPDVFLAGDGTLAFADRTEAVGLGDERWTGPAVFFDADADGDLDLYVGAYVEIDLAHPTWCGGKEPGWRSACHPDTYAGLPDRFWRNQGDGTFDSEALLSGGDGERPLFRDATVEAGLAGSSGKCLGVVAADFDGDGDVDVYTANDSVENRFWRNDGDGTFTDDTLLSGTGVDERGFTEAGMGIAVGDVDSDLDLDLIVTNFDDESNTLYANDGEGLFRDRTVAAGLEAPSRMPVGFGVAFADFDHDGALDLAVANGHIIYNIHLFHDGKTHAQAGHLFAGDGRGRFRQIEAAQAGALSVPAVGRGLYTGDLDGDGDLDLLHTACGGRARILRNIAARGPSLTLDGAPAGALLTVTQADGTKSVRPAGTDTSYFGQGQSAVHFGVDPAHVSALELALPGGFGERFEREGDAPLASGARWQLQQGPNGWHLR